MKNILKPGFYKVEIEFGLTKEITTDELNKVFFGTVIGKHDGFSYSEIINYSELTKKDIKKKLMCSYNLTEDEADELINNDRHNKEIVDVFNDIYDFVNIMLEADSYALETVKDFIDYDGCAKRFIDTHSCYYKLNSGRIVYFE